MWEPQPNQVVFSESVFNICAKGRREGEVIVGARGEKGRKKRRLGER